jgi:nicotinamidase-related amidase
MAKAASSKQATAGSTKACKGAKAAGKGLLPLGARAGSDWKVSSKLADMTRAPRPVKAGRIGAQFKDIVVDWNKSAMIVVDMQNDFCHPKGWLAGIGVDVTPARAPIAPLAKMLPKLRKAGVPVIWVNWGNRPDLANISPAALHVYNGDGRSTGLGCPLPNSPVPGAKVLQKDSWAAAVVDELEISPDDIKVDKYRMSGFWDTPLDAILRNLGVTTVFFGGVNADQCVLATLMDANFLGYDTILVEDCTATTSPEYCMPATLYNVRTCFGFSATSGAMLKAL